VTKKEYTEDEIPLILADMADRLNFSNESDKAFFKRVYATPLSTYKKKIAVVKNRK